MGNFQSVPEIEHPSASVLVSSDDFELSLEEILNSHESIIDKNHLSKMINDVDSNGFNLFHRAIMAGNFELILEFLKFDLDLNRLTGHKRTPLELALFHKQNDIAILIWDNINKQMNLINQGRCKRLK